MGEDRVYEKIKKNYLEFLKFITVGLINTIFGYILYIIIQKIYGNYYFSLIIVYTIGMLFNYFTYKKLVFLSDYKNRIVSFIFVYFCFLILNIALINFSLNFYENEIILQGIFLPFFAVALYISLKKMVFKNET